MNFLQQGFATERIAPRTARTALAAQKPPPTSACLQAPAPLARRKRVAWRSPPPPPFLKANFPGRSAQIPTLMGGIPL